MGKLTNTRRSDGTDPDVSLRVVTRIKIPHYWHIYFNRPDPIDFIPVTVDTTGLLYDECIRHLFLDVHREGSVMLTMKDKLLSNEFWRGIGPVSFPSIFVFH